MLAYVYFNFMRNAQHEIRISVMDSHTAGEPTRVVLAGGPELGAGSMAERRKRFRSHFDHYRQALIHEPRGCDALVGALLCPPEDPASAAGVIFFNNAGYLGMCGHGAIGVAATLHALGRLEPGKFQLETPVGNIQCQQHAHGETTISNVASYRYQPAVKVTAPGRGEITGDIAWGGNWFFLVEDHGLTLEIENLPALTEFACGLRQALTRQGITGANREEIDHIELTGPSRKADARNFVLCPGLAYDRSPCGTGTSAKLACLHADGKLKPGEIWRQESIIGSQFSASYEAGDQPGYVRPYITGRAHITSQAEIILQPEDPFRWGITVPDHGQFNPNL